MTWWKKKPFIDGVRAYDKMSEREQKIVLVTLLSLLLMLSYLLVVEPLLLANQALYAEKDSLQDSNFKISQQIKDTLATQHQDPNVALRNDLITLNAEAERLQGQISLLTQALVAPKQMVSLLENVLTQDKQLKLISLINLPEQGLNIVEMSPEERLTGTEVESLIYQHAFEVELEATYDSSIAYLKRLDELPWQIFWQELKYESTKYPKGILKIKIYTLSMSKAVLGV
jgi:MSHA biogenesis protein MshJ